MKFFFLFILSILIFSMACKDDVQTTIDYEKYEVRYLAEEVCCGNLLIIDGRKIERNCDIPEDDLLKGINLNDFPIGQNLQDGDTLTVQFKLTDGCQAFCDIICNRWHAIPVELLSVE